MAERGISMRLATAAIVVAAALGAAPFVGTAPAWAATSKNLIKDGGAEKATGSTNGSVVPVPGWTMSTGATLTAVTYGAGGGFPAVTDPGPNNRGNNFFAGGPSDESNSIVATQTRPLKAYATAIAAGGVTFKLSGYLGGFGTQDDQAFVEIDFKDKHGTIVGSSTIGPVTEADRAGATGLLKRSAAGSVPATAKTVLVQLSLVRVEGSYNDGYADSLSLTLAGV